ncbi:MAG: TonB-dependent receptor [Blastocatellia bacterium]|nr:TonB-dependent receptor [Blastocatellia bacterium]
MNMLRQSLRGVAQVVALVVIGWVMLWCGSPLYAETTGVIVGTVFDPSGAVIAGATVTAKQTKTNFTRTTTTDGNGNYRFSAMPIGEYELSFEASGFEKISGSIARLNINQEIRLDFTLGLSKQTDDYLEVVVAKTEIATETAQQSTVIDNKKITELPLNGRNFLQLGALIPGVSVAPGGGGSEGGSFVGAFSVGGQRDRAANYQLDGADNNQPINNNAASFVNVDAIQEFTILTSTFSAEYGRNSGAVVNVATRSGTNDFHGTLFEFHRNNVFDARNFFENAGNAPDSKFILTQFGGVFGGPIKKNKAFFFMSYEGIRSRVGNTIFTNVPGNFFGFINAPPLQPDPVSLNLLRLFPAPNTNSSFGNFISNRTIRNRNDNGLIRVDYNQSSNDTWSARYLINDTNTFTPVLSTSGTSSGASQVPGFGQFSVGRTQNFTLSETHVFNGTVVNEARFSFGRVVDLLTGEDKTNPATLGLPTNPLDPRNTALPQIVISGFSSLGNSNIFPFGDGLNTYQVTDSLSLTRGSHTIKTGLDIRRVQLNGFQDFSFAGTITFDGSVSGVSPIYDFLQGTPSPQTTFITRGLTAPPIRQSNYYFFVQDDWKARPGLTLNLGLRYELNTVPKASGRLTNFTPERGFFNDREGLFAGDHNNFAPRVGFAWTPFAKKNFVIRGGAGMFYDLLFGNVPFNLTFNPPASVQFYPLFGTDPEPGQLGSVFADVPQVPDFADAGPALITIDPRLRTPYSFQWNLNLQKELPGGIAFEIGYFATRGVKQLLNRDINQAVFYPGESDNRNIFDRRPTQLSGKQFLLNKVDVGGIDLIQEQEAAAVSTYHSLQTRLSGRVKDQLSFSFAYTWSHSIDNASDIFGFTGSSGFPQDSRNLRAEKANSPFDVRHRFTNSFTWDLPFGRGKRFGANTKGITLALIDGWQVNGITTAQGGQPFSVRLGTDAALDGNPLNEQRPNDIPGAFVPDGKGGLRLTVPLEKLVPLPGQYGNLGRNTFRGPKFVNFDFSAFKNMRIKENLNLQFRSEFFNIFNHPNFALPETNLLSPTFGTFSRTPDVAAGSPRIGSGGQRVIQFALKLVF